MTVWITEVDAATVDAQRRAAVAAGLPLGGARLAVKDNIDVAGLPTTAAHPAFAHVPERSAHVVDRLVEAGAVVVGKANLDQFATGLVGTRSPYGVVPNPVVPGRVAGGSSSGSAAAVALGLADLALATDTAGSGRVPAALCGVVSLKPTRGLLSMAGVVPAVPSLDCVSVFAPSIGAAAAALALAADPEQVPIGTPVVGPGPLRIGVPRPEDLSALDEAAAEAWGWAMKELAALGPITTIDLTPYFEAGATVYDSFVAERWNAFGAFLAEHPDGADPTVEGILERARGLPAHVLAADAVRLPALRRQVRDWWRDVDVVVVPTVGEAPTIEEAAADPLGVNTRLGRFTCGGNALDLCAAAVPAGLRADGVPFGVTFLGPAFADPVVAAAGARLLGEPDPPAPPWVGWATVFVVGAHLRGAPLNHTLTGRGGRLLRAAATAAEYRLFALDTTPPKPGLVRVGPGSGSGSGSGSGLGSGSAERGRSIEGELWVLPLDAFGSFVAEVPPPLAIGSVVLDDGSVHHGFVCEPWATADAQDITSYGGWRAYQGR
jgi:allophanate hydrolase